MLPILTAFLGKLSNWFVDSVWGFFARHAGYVQKLEDNLADIETAVEDLMALKELLTRRVHVEEIPQTKRIALAEGHELIKGADQEVQRLCLGGYWSKNCWSTSIFGKKVDKCLNGLLALKTIGDQFEVVVEEAPAELVLVDVWSCFEDKDVGIVGLYDIGTQGRDDPHNSSAILGERSFNSLRFVRLFQCHELKELTWLILVPNLTTLRIQNCDKMEEIIGGVKLGDMRHQNFKPFSKLSFLYLHGLPRLMCIYPNALFEGVWLSTAEGTSI